ASLKNLAVEALTGWGHEDFHRGVIVIDQGVEAGIDQFIQGNLVCDERFQINFYGACQFNTWFMAVVVANGPPEVLFLGHQVGQISFWFMSPDRYVHDHACFFHGRKNRIQHNINRGRFEADVGAFAIGDLENFFHYIDLLWIHNVVCHASLLGGFDALFRQFGHDSGQSLRFGYCSSQEANWTGATDQGDIASFRLGTLDCVISNCQWFNQRSLIQWQVVWNWVYPVLVHGNLFGETATTPGQANEILIRC